MPVMAEPCPQNVVARKKEASDNNEDPKIKIKP
jgi:hypothetical protein